MDCKDFGDGYQICKIKTATAVEEKKDISFGQEVATAAIIATAPYMTKDEASYFETSFVSIIFSYISSAISIAFGFYIYYLIGSLGITIVTNFFWNSLLIMGLLLLILIIIAFIQYRITKALMATKIIERFALDYDDDKKMSI